MLSIDMLLINNSNPHRSKILDQVYCYVFYCYSVTTRIFIQTKYKLQFFGQEERKVA